MSLDDNVKALAAEFVFESNLIESIEIPLDELVSQLGSGNTTGHAVALLYLEELAKSGTYIYKQDLCFCQELIIEEQNQLGAHEPIQKSGIGFYRGPDVNVIIFGRMGMVPEKIERAMGRLLGDIRRFLKEYGAQSDRNIQQVQYIVKRIARFHYRFEQIHPFVDGNGRSGRLLVWYLFRFLGFMPFIFTDHDKRYTYYQSFDDVKEMEKYFLRRYKP